MCAKPSHSCFRNICSYAKLPGRNVLQRISRAFVHISRHFFKGWCLPSLEDAFTRISNGIQRIQERDILRPDDSFSCRVCNCRMDFPGVLVADAGQAYEALRPEVLEDSLVELFDLVRCNPHTSTVTVLHHGTMAQAVKFGGKINERVCNGTVFKASTIERAVRNFISMRKFNIGGVFACQQSGIPLSLIHI